MKNHFHQNIKSPLNYMGGKYKILNQILPLFPNEIDRFVDVFAGGYNVGINVNANRVYFNDNLIFLIEMYKAFKEKSLNEILEYLENRIKEYDLSATNEDGYKSIRKNYNEQKEPLDLFILAAYSFNHQIRFNSKHEKSRNRIYPKSFENLDFSSLNSQDLVYFDPPYLITTGTYNDGKRGFKGWSQKEETTLLELLDFLSEKKVRFALSNVLEYKGNSNDILKNWIQKNKNITINYINSNYANSNYQKKSKDSQSSVEVLITNYKTNHIAAQRNFFESWQ